MEMDQLRDELERLFELKDLIELSRRALDVDPEAIGGSGGLASYVRHLTDYCVEHDAIGALCDAVATVRPTAAARFVKLANAGGVQAARLSTGIPFAGWLVERHLGDGPSGASYLLRRPDGDSLARLKWLDAHCSSDRHGLERFRTYWRLAADVTAAGLPRYRELQSADGRPYVIHEHFEGQNLSQYLSHSGPQPFERAYALLRPVIEALAALHERGLAHGNVKPENILLASLAEEQPAAVLLDGGADRLGAQWPLGHLTPERLSGEPALLQGDLYAIGLALYHLLTGTAPFTGRNRYELELAHLTRQPAPPSARVHVSREVDELILQLLAKQPDERPTNAAELLQRLDLLAVRKSQRPPPAESEVQAAIARLLEQPRDRQAALDLESLAEAGADPGPLAAALREAYERLGEESADERTAKVDLAFRSGRLLRASGQREAAERLYSSLVELAPDDPVARTALEDLRIELGKHDELVEFWLAQHERAATAAERAELMFKIGQLYEQRLEEPSQALVAFTQALCESPQGDEYRAAVVRRAGKDPAAWEEVLSMCSDASEQLAQAEDKNALLRLMGNWYLEHLNRLDLALQCLQQVLASEPSDAQAIQGTMRIYRRAQQWPELAQLFLQQAEAAPAPGEQRKLYLEAARIYEQQLGDTSKALLLYEDILASDPMHEEASEALRTLYQRLGDHQSYARLLERQAEQVRGADRWLLLCRLGDTYLAQLEQPEQARERYVRALEESGGDHLEALKGLEKVYIRLEQYPELLDNLKQQVSLAATPRQKTVLLERIASLYEREFLDPQQAIETLRSLLELNPKSLTALSTLARLYRATGAWSDAERAYAELAAVSEDPDERVTALISRARIIAEYSQDEPAAIAAYEAVLKLAPTHAEVLAQLAELRQSAGDAEEALRAVDALAEKAPTPEAKVEHYLRAARLLLARKDLAGAVERYRLALEAIPFHPEAALGLRRAYVQLGDPEQAIDLLYEQLETIPPGPVRSKLTAELALLLYQHTEDISVAEQTAAQALEWNSASAGALYVLAQVAVQEGRLQEALPYYERLMPQLEALEREHAVECVIAYADALARSGAPEAALEVARRLRELAPDDVEALRQLGELTLEYGDPEFSREVYAELLERFGPQLPLARQVEIGHRYAMSLLRCGETEQGLQRLETLGELDPNSREPLATLAEVYEQQQDWGRAWESRQRLLRRTTGEERADVLIQLGELAAERLQDRERATQCFVSALELRPNDRRLLTRLMQLYTAGKDWANTVEVVLKLADFVEDDQQKARYLMTAGMIYLREMDDSDSALDCFERCLQLDPTLEKAHNESVAILRSREDHRGVETLLKRRMKAASAAKDGERLLEVFRQLGALYQTELAQHDKAIDAYEAALTLSPQERELKERLAELYVNDPDRYFDRAVETYTQLLRDDAYRADAYKALRRVYTERKNPDAAWCLCQALYVLKLAAPDEERFFKRMRSDDPAYAQAVLTETDYAQLLNHEDLDPLLTDLFGLIEPAVIASRGYELADLGYDPNLAVDLANHPYPIGQTLHYACGVMGLPPPPAFENTNDPGGLAFLDTKVPAISMGVGVLTGEIHPQALAFLAGRHLLYYRPGLFLRQLVGTGTGLKSWLFAAIKYISPQFLVAPELEGPVTDNVATLHALLSHHIKDDLARVVAKLLQSSRSLDLKRWVSAVDYTADRVGFALAHDLETAVEVIRSSEEAQSSVVQRRLKELVLYSISPKYFQLREALQINLSS